ncbi:MAG: hypothetical protein JSW63_07215 [Ignavibacterium sp.]|nr:MAG: hypothetical protein JSW63_07215 [Ignavibacterium sp.]
MNRNNPLKTRVLKIFEKEGNKAAERVAELAVKNKSVLKQVLDGATSENKRIKNAAAKCLREVSRINPKKLYPDFNIFVKLIDGDDTILKWNVIEVLSNLTEVDNENLPAGKAGKFNIKVLNKYFALLYDESMVTAANTITALGKVALNKPRLRNKITEELVKVDALPHSTECRNILAGHAFLAFEKYIDGVKDKKEIKLFVEKHLKNRRNATRKKAEKFYSSL